MDNNVSRKAARRAKLRLANIQRRIFGQNMFAPSVSVASVEPNSSPLGSMAQFGTTPLRLGSQFTGVPYQGLLGEAERSTMRRVGLPTSGIVRGIHPLVASHSFRPGETISPVEQAISFAIAEENQANADRTRLASSPNNAENVNANANEFIRTMPNRIREQQEVERARQIELAQLFAHARPAEQEEALRSAVEAAAQSAAMAKAAGVDASRPSLLERLMAGKPHGGRSRKYHRKMRKSRNKRGTRKH